MCLCVYIYKDAATAFLFHFAANVSINNRKETRETKTQKSNTDPTSRTSFNLSGQTPDEAR